MIRFTAVRAAAASGLVAVLLLAGAVTTLTTRTAHALTNCTVSDSSVALDAEESRFLTLINNYRAQNGLAALSVSTNLNRSSAWLAQDLGAKAYFSHTDSLGRSPSTRAQNCGYPSGAGENIAAGTVKDTAQEAFDMWKASSGHNANMLNASYRQIGIARAYVAGSPYGWYWVTDFGLVNDGTSGSAGGSSGGSTGGGATATPTQPPRTATPVTTSKAAITSPAPGSSIGTQATFTWSAGSGALEYFLYVGTSAGSNNMYGASMGLNRSITLSGFPQTGATIYVRLWTRFSTGWQYTDYTYRLSTVTRTSTQPTATATPTPTQTSGHDWWSRRFHR
ncbi:MAG: CAP domain-containing protein [Hyphomicrobiales bacterium]